MKRMTRCPKCQGGNIGGPHYKEVSLYVGIVERLQYVCLTCGYTMCTPTADDKAEKPLPI